MDFARRRPREGAKRGDLTGPNPTDRAKSGRKRHLLTDGRGVPLGLTLSGANVPDLRHALPTLQSVRAVAPGRRFRPQHCCMDKGYDYPQVDATLRALRIQGHIRRRGEGALVGRFRGKARRWVVERTNSWHNRFRSLLVSWERKAAHYLGLCHLANALIAYRVAVA